MPRSFKSSTEELRSILGIREGKPMPFTEFEARYLLERAGAIEDKFQSPIDLAAELDTSLSYEENRGLLIDKYGPLPDEFKRDRKEYEEEMQDQGESESYIKQEKEGWLDPLYNNDPDALDSLMLLQITKEEAFRNAYADKLITKEELKHYLSGIKEEKKEEKEEIIKPEPIMEKEPWEITQKEFVDAYYDSYKRKKLAEEKTEITESLKDRKQAYKEAVKAGKPVVAAREERYREFLETKLETNLKGTFTDPESAHQVILTQLHEDHRKQIIKALGEKKPVPSQIQEEWQYLISSIRLKESLKTCVSTMR